MESVQVRVIKHGMIVCRMSVPLVIGDPVIWSRGAVRAPGQDRLTDRWGKSLIRKMKQQDWIEGALLSDHIVHLIGDDVWNVGADELIDLFDRFMPNREISICISWPGPVSRTTIWETLPAPYGPRIPQR